ncbi:MAG TPA: hypothetical protein VFW07_08005 [Parafilimonas sp.]|nr:hypothetical protein [Parafilimonas sp.]
MLVAEHYSLKPVKVLISNSLVHLELFENSQGNLFLSSGTDTPPGVVYYSTTPSLFYAFLDGVITLQTLFNKTPSIFVEIKGKEKTALYSLNDVGIILTHGDKTIKQLTVAHLVEM